MHVYILFIPSFPGDIHNWVHVFGIIEAIPEEDQKEQ